MTGRIEIITGPMKSGKTELLIRKIIKTEENKKSIVFKPEIDTRTNNEISSRSGFRLPAITLHTNDYTSFLGYITPIKLNISNENTICFDEAQFFNNNFVNIVQELADEGKRIIISGLDMDYRRKPFGPMPQLTAIADEVIKLTATCDSCGKNNATLTKRMIEKEGIIVVGEEIYNVRCRQCFYYA